MISSIDVNSEPLPGYRLIERIGAGGYGEVWLAEAPGGLTKAIKLVFGQHHERRAAIELRALERVREVRHPFLLSLERIEVIDGRLLVVMELAGGSLKDRFETCRRQGLPGIPRNELLGYLRDAADALDFMSDQHSLQHLDIKPENLLLLADHVKVADFGLVKELQQLELSLMGGMTPLYAAPEVFQGAPSRHSDQYSLAVVYQEMLTGTLPFAGSSAAELTMQHLHDEPDVSPLTGADRYAVARALAKDPQHRYATCREFVEALAKAPTQGSAPHEPWAETPVAPGQAAETTMSRSSQTELFEEPRLVADGDWEPIRFTPPPSGGMVTDLGPIDVAPQEFRPVPTLFLGVGGIAGRVLNHLRQKMTDRFGPAAIPAMPMLWLDTDPTELAKANGRTSGRLLAEETIVLPLQRPQHYRERSGELLRWVSRRWLYNIPRSLRTQGLRPLGRLALVDHARQTGGRIRRALADAIDAEAVASSSQTLGRVFRDGQAQVYVIASISGGTGSGMALDLGYLVRAVLDKLDLTHTNVIGVMVHATGRDPNHSELARVNAFSWLTEFHHFQQPDNAYGCDAACCLPAHPPETPPFDHTYLVHLGDNLGTHDLDFAAQSVADYLELATLTPAKLFFDACRQQAAKPQAGSRSPQVVPVRSFGVFRKPAIAADVCDGLAAAISREVVAGWRGPSPARPPEGTADDTTTDANQQIGPPASDAVAASGEQLVGRLHLAPPAITALAQSLLEAELGTNPPTSLTSWLASDEHRPADNLVAVDQVFEGRDGAPHETGHPALLGRPAAILVRPLAEKLCREVRRWVIQHVDDPAQRLSGARSAAAWLDRYLEAAEAHIEQLRRSTAAQLFVLRNTATGGVQNRPNTATPPETPANEDPALRYFRLRLHQLALVAAQQMTKRMLSELKTTMDDLTAFGQKLDRLPIAPTASDGSLADDRSHRLTIGQGQVAGVSPETLRQLTGEVAGRLQTDYFGQDRELFATVMRGGRARAQLCARLHQYARHAAEHASASLRLFGNVPSGDAKPDGTLANGLKLATPSLLEHGGARRVLLVVPRDAADQASAAEVARTMGTEVSIAASADNSLTVCVEAEQLSLPAVAAGLVEYRRDRIGFADRVHSRTDVSWTPLVQAAAESADGPVADAPPVLPTDGLSIRQTEMI